MGIIKHLKDVAQGKAKLGEKRSGQWPRVRKEHLEKFPTCAVCGSKDNLECHHVRPFHLHPELELEPTNLITLCESKSLGGLNCHLIWGHLSNFRSWNENVVKDAAEWLKKFTNRPTEEK